MAESGPGREGTAREPQASLQGGLGPAAQLSPDLRPPPRRFSNLSVYVYVDGVPVGAWWPGTWGVGCQACWPPPLPRSSFEDLFLFPVSQL